MKKITAGLLLLLTLFTVTGCSADKDSIYRDGAISFTVPQGFSQVEGADIVCFAPGGSAVHNSNITFYSTVKNAYFADYDVADYTNALKDAYADLSLVNFTKTSIKGYNAHKVTFTATIEQSSVRIIFYAIDGDLAYFFTLLQREGDSCEDAFDEMIRSVKIDLG